MKKPLIACVLVLLFTVQVIGQVKLRQISQNIGVTNYFQVGYDVYTPLTIGSTGSNDGTGATWAIEHWDDGLNFWKPWPSVNYGNYKLFLGDNGSVGIGMKPEYGFSLEVAGIGSFDSLLVGTGIFDQTLITSDRRLKTNIKPLENPLEKLIKLEGKSYSKKTVSGQRTNKASSVKLESGSGDIKAKTCEADKKKKALRAASKSNQKKELGLIAQEVKKVFPDLVFEDNNGLLSVNYDGLIPVIIEALKEQNEKIEVLEALSKGQLNKDSQSKRTIGTNDGGQLVTESMVVQGASLSQNKPNPFSSETDIQFEVPSNATSASLHIYDLNGTQKKSYQLTDRGAGSITISASELVAGMYLYTLIVDGKEVDTKRMILTD